MQASEELEQEAASIVEALLRDLGPDSTMLTTFCPSCDAQQQYSAKLCGSCGDL